MKAPFTSFHTACFCAQDDWGVQHFPVDYDSAWARGRKQWEVYLDAYDAWHRETSRLIEVYKRQVQERESLSIVFHCKGGAHGL